MPKKESANGRALTVPEILQAIQALPSAARVALFTLLSEHPDATAPFEVVPTEWCRDLMSDLFNAEMQLNCREGRPKGRRRTEAETHATIYNLHLADRKKNSQTKLAKQFGMDTGNIRQILYRERKRRAKVAAGIQEHDAARTTFGEIKATWER